MVIKPDDLINLSRLAYEKVSLCCRDGSLPNLTISFFSHNAYVASVQDLLQLSTDVLVNLEPFNIVLIDCATDDRLTRIHFFLTSISGRLVEWPPFRNMGTVEGQSKSWVGESSKAFVELYKQLEKRDRWAIVKEVRASAFALGIIGAAILPKLVTNSGFNRLQMILLAFSFFVLIPAYILFDVWKLKQIRSYFPVLEFRFHPGSLSSLEKRRRLRHVVFRDLLLTVLAAIVFALLS